MNRKNDRPRGKKRPVSGKADADEQPPTIKRRPRTQTASPQKRQQNRPDPPPPPPQALIELLQSDPKVLAYFTSLQANLDADLNIWKERSKQYQTKCQSLETQLREFQATQKKKASIESRQNQSKQGKNNIHNDDDGDGEQKDDVLTNERFQSNDEEQEAMKDDNELRIKPAPPKHAQNASFSKSAIDITTTAAVAVARPIDDSMFVLSSSDDDDEEEEEEEHVGDRKGNTSQPLQQREPQETSFFLSSEEDNDDDDFHFGRASLPSDKNPAMTSTEAEQGIEDDIRHSASLHCGFIREARRCLARLGVTVVAVVSSQQQADDEDQQPQQQAQVLTPTFSPATTNLAEGTDDTVPKEHDSTNMSNSYFRRSDQLVLQDLLQAIRTLSRLSVFFPDLAKEQDDEVYSPFGNESMTPSSKTWHHDRLFLGDTCNDADSRKPHHPVWQGRWYACRALLLMDAYCDVQSKEGWTQIWSTASAIRHDEDGNDDDLIAIGMYDRKDLVEQLLSSLQGEIAQAWVVADLTAHRLQNDLLLQVVDEGESKQGQGNELEKSDKVQHEATSIELKNRLSHSGQNKRAALFERCILAQLAVTLHLGRGDSAMAFRMFTEYVLSASPSLASGEYPKYAPVLSLCVLEAMLSATVENIVASTRPRQQDDFNPQSWFSSFLQTTSLQDSLLIKALSLVLHATAKIWTQRTMAIGADDYDCKITAIASVEVASYRRLLVSESSWLGSCSIAGAVEDYLEASEELSNEVVVDILLDQAGSNCAQLSMALTLALVLNGNADSIFAKVQDATSSDIEMQPASVLLMASVAVTRQLNVRNLDWLQHKVGRPAPVAGISLQRISRVVVEWFTRQMQLAAKTNCNADGLMETALKCCSQLADGESVLTILSACIERGYTESSKLRPFAFSGMIQLVETPTVRVINLQRRCDRLDAFVAQSQLHNIRLIKAVVPLHEDQDVNHFNWDKFCGGFAFDGFGKPTDVEKRLSELVRPKQLDDLVKPTWIPSDLKAFDLNARSDEAEVDLSPSERACALSHLASWEGIRLSLQNVTERGNRPHTPHHLLRLLRTSGFARGQPLLHANERMPPSPVCLVLEDDAILVDRFVDRLHSILDELPRDFHFCSLGYGRPKTAPMVKYSAHVGIPTCLWYLTGYILSKDGADYLLRNLPICGPVDSWIGFQLICSNWDNVFGQALGVGIHSKPATDHPSRKDLAQILKFRAFAANVPLCSQKVASVPSTALVASQRKWRQRDTDITFSGS